MVPSYHPNTYYTPSKWRILNNMQIRYIAESVDIASTRISTSDTNTREKIGFIVYRLLASVY